MSHSCDRTPIRAAFHLGVLVLLAAACSSEEPTNDWVNNPVQPADGGFVGVGSGSAPDASSAGSDAGASPAVDASTPTPARPDATTPALDAGAQPSDAAAPMTVDAAPSSADAAPVSGDAGPSAGDGGFPRTEVPVNVSAKGPYTFKSYTEGLRDPAYSSAVMYYPESAPLPLAAIVFAPGYTATKENYTKLGELIASHGFAMMLTTPTDTNSDQPNERGKDLVAAVARIKLENERAGSPLQGKIAFDRVCVTGQSMGGGGTLWAASELGNKIRCAVPLQSWQPSQRFAMITAPTLFISAERDTVAGNASNSKFHYDSIPTSVEKIFAEFRGADHYLTTNRTTMWDDQARVMVPFYKLKLEDDERYRPYLYGGMEPKDALSRYEHSKN